MNEWPCLVNLKSLEKQSWHILKYYPDICQERLNRTMKILNYASTSRIQERVYATREVTPRSRALLQTLIFAPMVKKCFLFESIRKFITVFTRARHWTQSWDTWILSAFPLPISYESCQYSARSEVLRSVNKNINSTQKMETVHSSEASINFYQITQCHVPQKSSSFWILSSYLNLLIFFLFDVSY
jgi:hypothetical protein